MPIRELLEQLEEWAGTVGARVELGPALKDEVIDIFPEMITPFFGQFSFAIPETYRAFLRSCSSVRVLANFGDEQFPDWGETRICRVYSPDEIVDARGWVLIPEGVSLVDRRISTNHLVGFAVDYEAAETFWCFVTDRPDGAGELPIIRHCVNDPNAARYLDTGQYVGPDRVGVANHSFADWLAAMVSKVTGLKREDFDAMT